MDKWIVTYNEKVTMIDGWEMTEMDNDKFTFFHPSDRAGAEMFCRVIIREGGAAQLARFKPQPLMTVAS